jgi:hypothetical protein
VAGSALTAALVAAALPSLWPRPAVAEYLPVTFRRGAVSSARFTPDGQSVVYSASWEGQPYAAFLGRPASPDARDLQLTDARIMSVSSAGEMAVAFGPQSITHTFGERTLASVPMAGGARRDVETGVVDADWIPGTDALAIVRDPGSNRPWTVEFPAGKIVHEAPAAWSLRVSPDGSRVAFFEGPVMFDSPPQAMITVIDESGRKSTVSRGWAGIGLAWAPSGTEIWFTATRPAPGEFAPALRAVSLDGVERPVYRAPDWLVLHDISRDGKVLLARNTIHISLACKQPGDTAERDLTWQLASAARGLSPDGETVIFEDELLSESSGNPIIFRRRMDGSPAVSIGAGSAAALSPDGRSVLALSGGSLVVLPTGIGAKVTLPRGNVSPVGDLGWLSDSKRIVFTGDPGNGIRRGYVQEIPGGAPRAATPEGVFLAGRAASRDDSFLLGRVGTAWKLYPLHGGESLPVPLLRPGDIPLQWSHQGRYLYVARSDSAYPVGPGLPAADVERVELATGDRRLWNRLAPSDPVGVEVFAESLVITPDAQSYCYSYLRRLGDLFVVDGLR